MQLLKNTILVLCSFYLIGCGGGGGSTENKNLNFSLKNNNTQEIIEKFINAKSLESVAILDNNQNIKITKAPNHGRLKLLNNRYYYIPNNYIGEDFIEYKVNNQNKELKIYIYSDELNITKPYTIYPLNGTSIHKKINLSNSVKNLYIIFSNPTQEEINSIKISHNLQSIEK